MSSNNASQADKLICITVKSFMGMISFLPRPIAYFICESLAVLFHFLDRRHCRIGMINLGIAFPEKSLRWRKTILRKSFRQIGTHVVELSRLHRMTPEQLRERVRHDETYKNYQEAVGRGMGLIFLTGHLGCWELLSTGHSNYGHNLHALVRPLDNPCLDEWHTKARTRFGTGIIEKRNALRQMLPILRNGGEIGILLDQNVQEKDGVYVPLFGKPASTSAGLAAIAMKRKCPVLPAFIMPDIKKGYYRIEMGPIIPFADSGDRKKDLISNTGLCNEALEKAIRKFPEGWLWGHRRFKTQPDGSNPYR